MFAAPLLALIGFLAMAIPVAIHLLFKRRRKPVAWGAMRLLVRAIDQNRRRSRIQNVFLLLIRCLVLLLVGLALARPFTSSGGLLGSESRITVLVIDDGIISGLRDQEGEPELDKTIGSALFLIDQMQVGDQVSIISAGKPVRDLTQGPTMDLQKARRILEEMTPGTGSTMLESAIRMASDSLRDHDPSTTASIVLLGQWRKGSLSELSGPIGSNPFDWLDGTERSVELVASPPTTDPDTITVVESISVRRPVTNTFDDRPDVRSTISLLRLGNELDSINTTIRMSGDGIEETLPKPISIPRGSNRAMVDITSRLDPTLSALDGTSSIVVSIDDPSLPIMSSKALTIDTSSRIRVGIIDRENFPGNNVLNDIPSSEWIERALSPEDEGQIQVDYIDPTSINDRSLSRFDALVVTRPDLLQADDWITLRRARDSGLVVLVLPPVEARVHSWMDRFTRSFDIDLEHDLGVSMPETPLGLADRQPGGSLLSALDSDLDDLANPVEVVRFIKVDPGDSDALVPLASEDGDPMLLVWEPTVDSRGVLLLMTVPPHMSWTSLPVKPLMVPLFQELIRQGRSFSSDSLQVATGFSGTIPIDRSHQLRHASGYSLEMDESGSPVSPLTRTGTWDVLDASGARLSTLVVNPELLGSDPSLVSNQGFREQLESHGSWVVSETDEIIVSTLDSTNGSRISIILLITALLLLLLETILNRSLFRDQVPMRDPAELGAGPS